MGERRAGLEVYRTLPFDHCTDEHDSLALFRYRDPRMLLELVDRRMVEDISEYLSRYTGSRLEPPSFIVTPEELKSYIHLPAGEGGRVASLSEVDDAEEGIRQGEAWGRRTGVLWRSSDCPAEVVRMVKVPKFEKTLEDSATQPFDHLASATVRTFELVYSKGKTEILLSAKTLDDMGRYVDLFSQVYGELELEKAERRPALLAGLPAIVGLMV